MLFSRVHRRFTTWLALLAMVLGALAPTVAQAVVASSDRADWVEVCSVSGMIWVQADASAASSDSPSAPVADASMHCPWCTLHGGAADLPPVSVLAEPLRRQTEPPSAFFHAVTLSGTWAVAHARAPPLAI
ncbi:DUF2946 domain-containing protein [Hydrogenophaga sp. A37]|uniref:DUF2946 domain-containing protein n=1 Tax=Hydrogenophaga sp. A37 TaxID=1945864 RepID=UPI000984CE17|nr:DUF2946 domain-containing protein [Hydrogenophaga sp. A37]OOG80169.1 hypothetical protein B0E41_21290 [Hydrogenophaga sp. A37]